MGQFKLFNKSRIQGATFWLRSEFGTTALVPAFSRIEKRLNY